jgi:hypothetical protein
MRTSFFIVFALFLLAGCVESQPAGPSQASDEIQQPRFFIADRLGSACTVDEQGNGRSQAQVSQAFANLYNNSDRYISDLRRSTSLTVNHDAFSANWPPILFNSYAAAGANDQALARTIIDGLRRLSDGQRYLNEPELITRAQARNLPDCYSQGPDTPCPSHTPRFVARMYTNLLISAAVLNSYLTEDDRAAIMPWLDQGYKKFVLPELNTDQEGIYDFANNGMARLAYAALTNDINLARRELNERRRDFLRSIEPSGYIRDNSYRGVRALWYHTYGLDPALSYALVAREWGVDYFSDPSLGPRLMAAVDKTELGIRDHAAFRSVGNRGDSFSTDQSDAREFVHQLALNLYLIAANEFGVRLPASPRHQQLVRYERYSKTSGLSASCYYSGQ